MSGSVVRYTHDVVIDGGKVRKRKKGSSKQFREKFGHTPLSGLFLTDSSAIVDTPSANMENPSATIELQGDSSFAAKINRYHGCRQVLRPSPWVLRAPSHRPSRNSPRASIFELASMLNEARTRKAGDLPSSRRKGTVRVAKGERPRYVR